MIRVVSGLLWYFDARRGESKLLLQQRHFTRELGSGLWETPGGKVMPGEDPIFALEREWREELNLNVVARPLPVFRVKFHEGGVDYPPCDITFYTVAHTEAPITQMNRDLRLVTDVGVGFFTRSQMQHLPIIPGTRAYLAATAED